MEDMMLYKIKQFAEKNMNDFRAQMIVDKETWKPFYEKSKILRETQKISGRELLRRLNLPQSLLHYMYWREDCPPPSSKPGSMGLQLREKLENAKIGKVPELYENNWVSPYRFDNSINDEAEVLTELVLKHEDDLKKCGITSIEVSRDINTGNPIVCVFVESNTDLNTIKQQLESFDFFKNLSTIKNLPIDFRQRIQFSLTFQI